MSDKIYVVVGEGNIWYSYDRYGEDVPIEAVIEDVKKKLVESYGTEIMEKELWLMEIKEEHRLK